LSQAHAVTSHTPLQIVSVRELQLRRYHASSKFAIAVFIVNAQKQQPWSDEIIESVYNLCSRDVMNVTVVLVANLGRCHRWVAQTRLYVGGKTVAVFRLCAGHITNHDVRVADCCVFMIAL